ncbi:dual specificity protein phosphatase 1B-like [Herrania umbratica]|uniref:Dual specificity protein phosphatase 1B-like n=1 Tax=Herrania umbratica TaxID=108875 RepID=A0A6J1AW89_9ROSI|nr:dual specificity protein phosphatase 1B-like [Herrania umbratica]XP_021291263.1 dual specificity protein phosphatase 1B-like [Herrania umbratica]XP_021291264.1 dual specificity protein phosphatase 1B-like [Herrania umbratica]
MDHIDTTTQNEIPETWRVNRYFEASTALCQIEEGLFLGSLGDASNKSALKSSNVTHILTVANLSVPSYPNDFVYKIIEVMDREDTNLMQHFDECFSFIDEAKRLGGAVLVHCFMGISRSVTVVVAYLMKKRGMSFSQALEHVKRRRPQASPNSGFILQLQHFGKTLQGKEDEKSRFDLFLSLCQSIFSFFNKKQ